MFLISSMRVLLPRPHQPFPDGPQLEPLDRARKSPEGLIPKVWLAFVCQLSSVHKLPARFSPVGNGAMVVVVLDPPLRLVGGLALKVLG